MYAAIRHDHFNSADEQHHDTLFQDLLVPVLKKWMALFEIMGKLLKDL